MSFPNFLRGARLRAQSFLGFILLLLGMRSLPSHPIIASALTSPQSTQHTVMRHISTRVSGLHENAQRDSESPTADVFHSDDESVVSIAIKRTFENVTPLEALDAWLESHWKLGGGLPILVKSENYATDSSNSQLCERTIYPVLMKEVLTLEPCDEDALLFELKYKVTDPGPFYQDVIDGSHYASVTFGSTGKEDGSLRGCEMVWNVLFSVSRWTKFYEAMTQFLVAKSANTLQEVLANPRVLAVTTSIDTTLDAASARKECLNFVWMEGGGLPLPPPIPFGPILDDGITKQNLLRIPPFLTESITDTFDEPKNTAGFSYKLNNPGWLTFPFLMHSHKGNVRICSDDRSLSINWDVAIRPYAFAAPLVEKLVEMTVTTLLRNLRVRLVEPGSTIAIKPPRGNTNLLMGMENFGSVPKETWLGGVLGAHLSDRRSMVDQTISLIQPWTWGRSGNGDNTDVVRFYWSEFMEVMAIPSLTDETVAVGFGGDLSDLCS